MTHEEYLATKRFPALDGVRAIAAVLVVVFHYGGPNWVRANGWIGVHLFFVMSGFLITTLALREEARNGRVSLANFYIRRAFRILPVYYVVLGVIALYTYLKGGLHGGFLDGLPWNFAFFSEYHQIALFGQAWTLGVEQKFYLLWPLLAFGIAGLGFAKRLSLSMSLVVALIALIPFVRFVGAYSPILIGCALALMLHYSKGFAVLRVFTRPAVGIVVAALLVTVQITCTDISSFLGDDDGTVAGTTYVVLAALLIPSLIAGGPLTWVLSRAPMRFIGERSYSLYLFQQVAAVALAGTLPQFGAHRTLTAIAVTIVGLLAADLLYRWVELPMIEVGRKLIARRQGRAGRRDASTTDQRDQKKPETAEAALV
jgi:peptidoglycan/LPS O-acetylase OafA/YrhL